MFHDAFATSTICVNNDGGPLLDGDIGVLITSTHDAVNVDNDGKPLLEH
jgi:hypothetical protein